MIKYLAESRAQISVFYCKKSVLLRFIPSNLLKTWKNMLRKKLLVSVWLPFPHDASIKENLCSNVDEALYLANWRSVKRVDVVNPGILKEVGR